MGQAIVIKGADYSAKNLGKVTLPYSIPYSSEALEYLQAVGIEAGSSKGMDINTFFHGLMKNNLFTKIDSGYLFTGETIEQVNVNFKTPTQRASLLNENKVNGGVYVGNGGRILLNNNILKRTSGHVCAFNKTVEDSSGIKVLISSNSLVALSKISLSRIAGTTPYGSLGAAFGSAVKKVPIVNEVGTLIATYEDGKSKLFSKGIKLAETNAVSEGDPVDSIYLGASGYMTKSIISYVSVGTAMTEAEVIIYNNLIDVLVSKIH